MQDERQLTIKALLDNIPSACDFVVEGASAAGLDERAIYHCQLAVDETITNIVHYGVETDAEDIPLIDIVTGVDDKSIFIISISDGTPHFNPLDHEEPNPKATLEERDKDGGWGIYFIKKLMDAVDYRYEDDKNVLTLHKFIPQNDPKKAAVDKIFGGTKPLEKNYWQIDLAGRLDSKASRTLEEILNEALMEHNHTRLIVNLEDVEYISSSGLKALVSAWRYAREQGGDVLLTSLQARIKEIFDMIGFDMMFHIFESPSAAVDADPIG